MSSIHHFLVSAIRDAVVPDIERRRLALVRRAARILSFDIIFRAQADQALRIDAMDATLGVALGVLIAIFPLVLTTARDIDETIVATMLTIPIGLVSRALFFLGGDVPNGALIAQQFVRDLFHGGSKAARMLAQFLEDDYIVLRRKTRFLRAAYLTAVLIGSGTAALHTANLDDRQGELLYWFKGNAHESPRSGGLETAHQANGQNGSARADSEAPPEREIRGLRSAALISSPRRTGS